MKQMAELIHRLTIDLCPLNGAVIGLNQFGWLTKRVFQLDFPYEAQIQPFMGFHRINSIQFNIRQLHRFRKLCVRFVG